MKKLVAWPLCQATYWLGDLCSKICHRWDIECCCHLYQVFMGWSVSLNDWGGLRVWRKVEEGE